MTKTTSVWKSIRSILVVIPFEQADYVNDWREAIKNAGLNVHNCRVLCIVPSKKERLAMREMSYITFISEDDYNFIGKLKNEDAVKIFSDNFDGLLVVYECSKKILKSVKKMKFRMDIGLNTGNQSRMINLQSVETSPNHLLNFVKQTLERIT